MRTESPNSPARIWLPLPPTHSAQTVEILELNLPRPVRFTRETEYGNRMLYVETTTDGKGSIEFSARFDVRRNEILASRADLAQPEFEKARRERLLQPDRLVPLTGRPEELLADWVLEKQTLDRARQLYEIVDQHMAYDKSKPGYGNGDVLWACESGTGNCTDFHSLFISLARNQGIPAIFEIGLPLPEKRGSGSISGYHCWAQFHVEGHGWIPIDISEADKQPARKDYYFGNLTENRVTFSYGRDLRLEPPQSGPPLNYFVLPHVEIDGHPVKKEQLDWKLEYQDLPAETRD